MKIEDIKKPIIIDKVLPISENIEMLKHFSTRPLLIQHEGLEEKGVLPDEASFITGFSNNYNHVGFALELYDYRFKKCEKFDPLFIWSRIIFNSALEKLNLQNFKNLARIHWNYYLAGQQGVGHTDREEDNFVSMLYNPHTTDGGTEILGEFYPDVAGQLKIFKSNWLHKGVSSKKDKARASVNIVLEF